MPSMPAEFWNGWIIVITLVSLAAMVWLVLSIYFSKDANHKEDGPVWDSNLREGAHAPPLWWFWLILGSTIFSLIYLILYPGLGLRPGVLDWDQGSQAIHSYAEFEARYQPVRDEIAAMGLLELQNDTELMNLAQRIYQRECAACHGPQARGQASLFPNLMDTHWQWGASAESIEQTIRLGRDAIMPPMGAALSAEQVSDVVTYVQNINTASSANLPGRQVYFQFCAACHGPDGAGLAILGAPNLVNGIWLYGGDTEAMTETVVAGRHGIMPAFSERLDDAQIRLLVAWLAR